MPWPSTRRPTSARPAGSASPAATRGGTSPFYWWASPGPCAAPHCTVLHRTAASHLTAPLFTALHGLQRTNARAHVPVPRVFVPAGFAYAKGAAIACELRGNAQLELRGVALLRRIAVLSVLELSCWQVLCCLHDSQRASARLGSTDSTAGLGQCAWPLPMHAALRRSVLYAQ